METLASQDPRIPGGRYLCGYWRQEYEVLAIWQSANFRDGALWIRQRWSDGNETQHCTPWDARRDRVLSDVCQCEHQSHFDDFSQHEYGKALAGQHTAFWVGRICDSCANGHYSDLLTA